MRFEDFVLQLDASPRGGFRARVLKSPFGEGVVGFSLPSFTRAEPALYDVGGITRGITRDLSHPSASAIPNPPLPPEIGADLYRAVFQGQVRTLLDKCRGQLEISPELGLRLKLKLDPSEDEAGALADLPWELLCDGDTEDFFALSRQTSLVRYLDVPRPSQPIPFTPPLRILVVSASPRPYQPLDLEAEIQGLDELNRASADVEVGFLSHASTGAVREALSQDTYNIVHFMGHGTFDPGTGEGMLVFEGPNGAPEPVSGRAVATKLKDLRSLGVVVLNACDTARDARHPGASPFRGVASALVLGGVPAVVAMQQPISDVAAIRFSAAFYRHLARGVSVDEALTEGRQAIHSARPDAFEWATPVLFLRIPDGNVFVAKPAARKKAPLVKALTRTAQATAVSRRGLSVKIACGTAGAVLLSFGLYKLIPLTPASPSNASNPLPSPTSEMELNETDSSNSKMDRQGVVETPPDRNRERAVVTVADLSSLSAQMVAIERRDEGGLRVAVSFTNTGDRPLSVLLDAEGSTLNDDQGQMYSILATDLPMSGSRPRLDLAPGASRRYTLDFQAPKLGSKQFRLTLLTKEGRQLKVAGTLTSEGPS